jgi:DNA replication and repair protein RecF
MHIRSLTLRNFRLYEEIHVDLSPGINVIEGLNACGKTTLLEAIYIMMTGRSFRTTQTRDMIKQGSPAFHSEIAFVKRGVEQKISFAYNGKQRKIFYNATECSSALHLLGILHGVIVHPEDVAIAKGAPAARRQFIDIQLGQTDPLYVHHITRFYRAMHQRNALLKIQALASIEMWEQEMAKSAAYIIEQRAILLGELDVITKGIYSEISGGKEELQLSYKASGAGEHKLEGLQALQEIFVDQYHRHRSKEMALGSTLTGPHRDDFIMTLGGQEVRAFGSEGQQRACVIALRLAEWRRVHQETEEKPVMLIDDIGISLDVSRRRHLAGQLAKLGQVIVTTAEEHHLIQSDKKIFLQK